MKVTVIGLDLAKNVFQVHGVDEGGQVVLRRKLRRDEVAPFFANLPPCLVGMEACGGSHFWARKLRALGHDARLMAPQFVKPYLKEQKNDANDARAICEAVSRPSMRFVAVKSVDQQAMACVHRVRSGWVKARTALTNQIRGMLAEFGVVLPQGMKALRERLPEVLEDGSNELSGLVRRLMQDLLEQLKQLDAWAQQQQRQIEALAKQSPSCQRLQQVPGIGPITATALVSSMGDGAQYENSRQASAAVGIVPRQHSSGGKSTLLGITKRGDPYLRYLLIHGARAVIKVAMAKPAHNRDRWLAKLLERKHPNVAAVALANRNARIAWALLRHERTYQPGYLSRTQAAAA